MLGDVRARKYSKTGARTRSILEKFAFDTTLTKTFFLFFSPRFHGIDVKRNYTKRIDFYSKPKAVVRHCTLEKLNPWTLETIPAERKIIWAKREHLPNFQVCYFLL